MSCELPTVYGCDKPKARKAHRCCDCRGSINVGETYHRHHGIWDGRASTFKVCADCEALRAEVDKGERDPESCTAFGELGQSIIDSWEPQLFVRYMGIKRKRGAVIAPCMAELEMEMQKLVQ